MRSQVQALEMPSSRTPLIRKFDKYQMGIMRPSDYGYEPIDRIGSPIRRSKDYAIPQLQQWHKLKEVPNPEAEEKRSPKMVADFVYGAQEMRARKIIKDVNHRISIKKDPIFIALQPSLSEEEKKGQSQIEKRELPSVRYMSVEVRNEERPMRNYKESYLSVRHPLNGLRDPDKRPLSKLKMDTIIGRGEIMWSKNVLTNIESENDIQGMWVTKRVPVRVIKNEYYESCPRVEDSHLVPIHGRIKLKFFNFLVTPAYNQNTLQKQLAQFGLFTEQLVFKHIGSIFQGLSALHQNGVFFDFLTLDKVIVDFQGRALIDVARYQPSPTITNEDKKKHFFYLSPEIILDNESLPQNDSWSLGCLALSMMLGRPIDSDIEMHPYNIGEDKLEGGSKNEKLTRIIRFRSGLESNKVLLPKIMPFEHRNSEEGRAEHERIGSYVSKLSSHESKYIPSKVKKVVELQVSQELIDFIDDCLQLDNRPTLQTLRSKYHFLSLK